MSEWKEIRRPFREALISAYNWNSLNMVLRYHCDVRLDRITAESEGFDTNVDDVIDEAVRNGWLEKLAQGALEENQRHAGLTATVPHIVDGVAAEGTAYYQGDVFEAGQRDEERQGSDTREPGTTQTIVYGDIISVGDISGAEGIAIGRSSSASVEKSAPEETGESEPGGSTSSTSADGPDLDVRELHRQLVDQFNVEELADLCFALGVEFEELGGSGKSAKARELVQYMQRRGRLDELDRAIREERG